MDNAKVISRSAAIARFLICSIIGICVFFVKFPLGGASVLPIDYINNLFTTWLKGNNYLEVSIFGSALLVYFTVVKKKFWKTAKSNKLAFFFDLMGLMAFVLIILTLLRICPPVFEVNSTLSGAYSLMGKMFIQIMIIMFFIPFLTDYGLPEAIGVFVQPFCRAIWAVPGRVAVIIVSAFLGNFTVGHVQANMYYTSGRVTHREALVMALGFSTPSIGLILSLCSTAGVTDRFPLICALILICVLVVTSIVAHIPPLSKYPDEYYEGIEPNPEVYEKGNLLTIAFNTGVETCQKNSGKIPVLQNCRTFCKAFPSVSSVCFVGVGTIVFFGLINYYTPIFTLLGYIFWPVLKVLGMQADIIAPMMGLGTVSTIASQTGIITAAGATMATKVFGVGYVMVVLCFFGSFMSSLYSTKITIKLRDFLLVYFERAYLTIIVYGLACQLLFR
ncbi:MAG: hypothetical protein HDT14_10690 [Oscillibacter sp.]|nr:hypothetical protein [Oscillibacter sp.]